MEILIKMYFLGSLKNCFLNKNIPAQNDGEKWKKEKVLL